MLLLLNIEYRVYIPLHHKGLPHISASCHEFPRRNRKIMGRIMAYYQHENQKTPAVKLYNTIPEAPPATQVAGKLKQNKRPKLILPPGSSGVVISEFWEPNGYSTHDTTRADYILWFSTWISWKLENRHCNLVRGEYEHVQQSGLAFNVLVPNWTRILDIKKDLTQYWVLIIQEHHGRSTKQIFTPGIKKWFIAPVLPSPRFERGCSAM